MKEQEATEIEKAFEEFWRVEVISAVTGEVDTGMWGNLDKEMASDVWRYAAAPLLERIAIQRNALLQAKEKLQLYRKHSNGEYQGGMEYTQLIQLIDTALHKEQT